MPDEINDNVQPDAAPGSRRQVLQIDDVLAGRIASLRLRAAAPNNAILRASFDAAELPTATPQLRRKLVEALNAQTIHLPAGGRNLEVTLFYLLNPDGSRVRVLASRTHRFEEVTTLFEMVALREYFGLTGTMTHDNMPKPDVDPARPDRITVVTYEMVED